MLRRLKVDFTPIHFLRNGLPEGVFAPGPRAGWILEQLRIPEDAFILMTVTRFSSEKRLDRVLRALAGLRREIGPEGDLKAAYRRWYADEMEEHDRTMLHMMQELERRGGGHAC